MSFDIGENVGPYRITDRLGQGGMATVYRAYHPNLDRYVAIKVLHTAFKEDPTFIARFQREAQIVAKLEHPSIVPIYDYSEHKGEPYLVMKFIEGDTLKGRLQKNPLTLEETLKTMTAVAEALTYAHARGVLHRDIKPSNVLLETGEIPYLADFGLARMASAGESTLSQDVMLGTPQYISPEQAQGYKDLDGRTDIYSLGVMLYELVVGRVPFNADTPYAIVHDHIYSPLPMPTQVNPQVPPEVERVLLKALAKNRADRYESAVDLARAFKDAVHEAGLTELSAGKYRVPIPGTATTRSTETVPPPIVPGVAPAPLPGSIPSIPSPIPSTSMPGMGSTAERMERQRRRANLWILGGLFLLILTCIAGLFLTISLAGDAAIKGSLFMPQPGGPAQLTPPGNEQGVVIFGDGNQGKGAQPPTVPADGFAVTTETPGTIAQPTEGPVSPTLSVSPSPVPSLTVPTLADAEKAVADHPTDPVAHFELALALDQSNRRIRALDEFQKGLTLAQDNPALLMQIGGQLAKVDQQQSLTTLVYTYAYAVAPHDPTVRSEAGAYIFRFAMDVKKVDQNIIKRMEDLATAKQSGGLAAIAALGYQTLNQPSPADKALESAARFERELPEVHLVRGILYAAQGRTDDAQLEYDKVLASKAPSWVIEQARELSAHKGS